jgi:hypothetical protein
MTASKDLNQLVFREVTAVIFVEDFEHESELLLPVRVGEIEQTYRSNI